MSFCAVDDKKEKKLIIIWDLGRRCTFSCSYCPPHRKNNWSKTASFDELVKTADTLERYSQIYNSKRNEPFRNSCSFTGGEPTVNPDFFPFLEYLQDKYSHWKRTITTNGFYSERKLRIVMANTDFTTISYHCESTPQQKKQVRHNIETMLAEGYSFKINIMFHENPEYFDECIALAEWCDDNGVQYTPRVIGDQGDVKVGLRDKTVHTYTPNQIAWIKRYWDAKKSGSKTPAHDASNWSPIQNKIEEEPSNDQNPKQKVVGQSIGRPCCGGRNMELLIDDEWTQSTFVTNNNFQGWNCMINWYFLYIHQEIDKIWHHQTCQVNLDGDIGPICSVSNFDEYCDQLERKLNTGSFSYIKCPKRYCGCGLCVPKAKYEDLAKEIFKRHAPGVDPKFIENNNPVNKGSLKAMVYKFDKEHGNDTER